MRRLLHQAFNGAARVSAVLCALTITAWALAWRYPKLFMRQSVQLDGVIVREHIRYWGWDGIGFGMETSDGRWWHLGRQSDASLPQEPTAEQLKDAGEVAKAVRVVSLFERPRHSWEFEYEMLYHKSDVYGMHWFSPRLMQVHHEASLRRINVPFLALTIVTGVLPGVVLAQRIQRWLKQRREIQAGLCISCGYDLRASPDRCPECGAIPNRFPPRRSRRHPSRTRSGL